MKHKLILTVAAGVCALASLSANANTLTVGAATTTPGAGFVDYSYPIIAANASINTTDPSFVNINDFGIGVVQANTLPGTWTFSQPLVGMNTGSLGVDNPTIADALFVFSAGGAGPIADGTYNITIRTTQTLLGNPAQWTSSDRQTAGIGAGLPSAAQGFVLTPVGFVPRVPEGGTTITLLGFALAGLAALRRKLAV